MRAPVAAVLFMVCFTTAPGLALTANALNWEDYKGVFLTADGRVVDYQQNRISHSEGQGYGLLLAVSHGDRLAFDRMWKWTRDNLQVRKTDALFAWSWGQRANGEWLAIDLNNATDGDLLIAFALFEAERVWQDETYGRSARDILESIKKHLLASHGGKPVLLPGYSGFTKEDGVVVNPAYFIFPAFAAFVRADESALWQELSAQCREILSVCRFSGLNLPPDWALLRGHRVELFLEKGTRYSYDAVRVPLYLAMGGELTLLDPYRRLLDTCRRLGYVPVAVDLAGGSLALEEAPAGFYAVYARVAKALGAHDVSAWFDNQAAAKIATEDKNYYSATLFLLARGFPAP
jgi:endoglucanase